MSRPLPLLILCLATPAFAQSKLPPDLALVPEDGLGFVHVRVSELWGHESLKDVRDILKKAGEKNIAEFDKRFGGLASNVERITMWMGPTRSKYEIESDALFIVRFLKPADMAQVRKLLVPDAKEKKGKVHTWYEDGLGACVLIADDRTIALGAKAEIARLADGVASKTSPLRDALAVAAGDRPIVLGLNPALLPVDWLKDLLSELPKEFHSLLKTETITASYDLVGDGHIHLRAKYPDEAAAEASLKAIKSPDGPVRKLIASSRKDLEELIFEPKKLEPILLPLMAAAPIGLGVLNRAEEIIASDKLRRDGTVIELTLEMPTGSKTILVPAALATGAGIGTYATQWREMAMAKQTNDLRQMLLGMHNYHDTNGQAVAAITDADGKPLLSWRVALLAYIEEDNLAKQMKLDEPWDSEHNKKFIDKMPKIFAIDNVKTEVGYTHYRTFVGEKAPWAFNRPLNIAGIPDGSSNTVIFVQAKDPVIWTKPDELIADGKLAIQPRLLFRDGRTVVGFGDGTARVLKESIEEKIWKLLIDPADGEVIPDLGK
jgi:hypothetical protein